MAALPDLSNELLYAIAENLDTKDFNTLSQVNKRFQYFFAPILNRRALHPTHTVTAMYWAAATGNSALIRLLLEEGQHFKITEMRADALPLLFFKAPLSPSSNIDILHKKVMKVGRNALVQNTAEECTPLHLAVANKRSAMLESLLDMGADAMMEVRNTQGLTALHYAASEVDELAVRLLLSRGAVANVFNAEGISPIHLAAIEGNEAITRLLLEHGADSTSQDDLGDFPFEIFLEGEAVALLLLKSAGPAFRTHEGRTALHLASKHPWEQEDVTAPALAKSLLESGLDIDIQDSTGNTALHEAVFSGKVGLVKTLLVNGANSNLKNSHGSTPLHIAYSTASRNEHLISLLIEHGSNPNIRNHNGNTIVELADHGDGFQRLPEFVLKELEPDFRTNREGRTLLHLAVLGSRISLVEKLLDDGADIADVDAFGWTALHFAAALHYDADNEEILELLIKRGADFNARTTNGDTVVKLAGGITWRNKSLLERIYPRSESCGSRRTSLHFAVKSMDVKLTQMLLDKGFPVNAQDGLGATPLHYAAWSCNIKNTKLLLRNGAQTNIQNKGLEVPIVWAIRSDYSRGGARKICREMAELLLDGVDVNDASIEGSTLLHEAAIMGNEMMMVMLKERGADETMRNILGLTAAQLFAIYSESVERSGWGCLGEYTATKRDEKRTW